MIKRRNTHRAQKMSPFSPNLVRHLFKKDASCTGTGQAAIFDLQDQLRGPRQTSCNKTGNKTIVAKSVASPQVITLIMYRECFSQIVTAPFISESVAWSRGRTLAACNISIGHENRASAYLCQHERKHTWKHRLHFR